MYSDFPVAIGLIVVATYLVLLLLFRSLLLPLKAILMNSLSILASYGALVWIFQEGHLHGLLRFEPLGFVEASLPIIMFCVLFGLSMDYEVFLLSRMRGVGPHGRQHSRGRGGIAAQRSDHHQRRADRCGGDGVVCFGRCRNREGAGFRHRPRCFPGRDDRTRVACARGDAAARALELVASEAAGANLAGRASPRRDLVDPCFPFKLERLPQCQRPFLYAKIALESSNEQHDRAGGATRSRAVRLTGCFDGGQRRPVTSGMVGARSRTAERSEMDVVLATAWRNDGKLISLRAPGGRDWMIRHARKTMVSSGIAARSKSRCSAKARSGG